jgi:hypothetical protein
MEAAKLAACCLDVHYQSVLRAPVSSEEDLKASGDLAPRLSSSCFSSYTGLLLQAEFGQLLPQVLVQGAKCRAVVFDNVGQDMDGPDQLFFGDRSVLAVMPFAHGAVSLW